MAEKLPEGFRVAILATNGFEQAELEKPRKALEQAGAETIVASPARGSIQGMNHDEKGDKVKVDMPLAKLKASDFDAVLLPGGVANADKLRMEKEAQAFVKEIDGDGKPIAVICHGPWLLISAGLAKGRQLTSYYTLQDDVRNSGAKWTDEQVVRDKNWVSSRKPDDIPAFNEEMLALFAGRAGKSKSRAAGR